MCVGVVCVGHGSFVDGPCGVGYGGSKVGFALVARVELFGLLCFFVVVVFEGVRGEGPPRVADALVMFGDHSKVVDVVVAVFAVPSVGGALWGGWAGVVVGAVGVGGAGCVGVGASCSEEVLFERLVVRFAFFIVVSVPGHFVVGEAVEVDPGAVSGAGVPGVIARGVVEVEIWVVGTDLVAGLFLVVFAGVVDVEGGPCLGCAFAFSLGGVEEVGASPFVDFPGFGVCNGFGFGSVAFVGAESAGEGDTCGSYFFA